MVYPKTGNQYCKQPWVLAKPFVIPKIFFPGNGKNLHNGFNTTCIDYSNKFYEGELK